MGWHRLTSQKECSPTRILRGHQRRDVKGTEADTGSSRTCVAWYQQSPKEAWGPPASGIRRACPLPPPRLFPQPPEFKGASGPPHEHLLLSSGPMVWALLGINSRFLRILKIQKYWVTLAPTSSSWRHLRGRVSIWCSSLNCFSQGRLEIGANAASSNPPGRGWGKARTHPSQTTRAFKALTHLKFVHQPIRQRSVNQSTYHSSSLLFGSSFVNANGVSEAHLRILETSIQNADGCIWVQQFTSPHWAGGTGQCPLKCPVWDSGWKRGQPRDPKQPWSQVSSHVAPATHTRPCFLG